MKTMSSFQWCQIDAGNVVQAQNIIDTNVECQAYLEIAVNNKSMCLGYSMIGTIHIINVKYIGFVKNYEVIINSFKSSFNISKQLSIPVVCKI